MIFSDEQKARRAAYMKEWQQKNKDYRRSYSKAWREKNKEKVKSYHFPKRYGITAEEWKRLSEAQGHVCAICGGNPGVIRTLCVDHDHETGKVRGLLCDLCNKGIGQFKERLDLLEKAVKYLRARK